MIRGILSYIWNKITYIPDLNLEVKLERYLIRSCYNRSVPIYETCIYYISKRHSVLEGYRVRRIAIDEAHAKIIHYRAVKDAVDLEMGIKRSEEFFWEKV